MRVLHKSTMNHCRNDDTETAGAMAWKTFSPSIRHTISDSMFIGSLISLLSAISIGTIYIALAFLIYKTVMNCQYQQEKMTLLQQWMRTIADIVSTALIYFSPVLNLLFLFRSFQLKGLKQKRHQGLHFLNPIFTFKYFQNCSSCWTKQRKQVSHDVIHASVLQ